MSQKDLYAGIVRPHVGAWLTGTGDGATVVLYGSCGSGKSYTLIGDSNGERRGVLMRCVEDVLNAVEEKSRAPEDALHGATLWASACVVCGDTAFDLVSDSTMRGVNGEDMMLACASV